MEGKSEHKIFQIISLAVIIQILRNGNIKHQTMERPSRSVQLVFWLCHITEKMSAAWASDWREVMRFEILQEADKGDRERWKVEGSPLEYREKY